MSQRRRPSSNSRRHFVARSVVSVLTMSPIARLFAMARDPGVQGMHEVVGAVRVNGGEVQQGAAVLPGDSVETGPGARAVYVVGRSVLLQRENSRVALGGPATNFTEEDANPVIHLLRVLTGKLLSVHARGALSLETQNGSIGIRGTGLYVDVQPSRTYACVCYGTADLLSAGGELLETVRTTHHESPRYLYPANASQPMEEAPVVDHTDDELIMLESLAGRRPPFLRSGGGRNY